MTFMFDGCKSLSNIDISKLDTSSVTSMAAMFTNCESLSCIDLSNLNAPNVTDMASMFSGCKSPKICEPLKRRRVQRCPIWQACSSAAKAWNTINLAGIKTPKVTDVSAMFSNCCIARKHRHFAA